MYSGIYCLLFTNNTYYVGKSTDISRRYKEHIKAMQNGVSFTNIQNSFKIAGIPEIVILENCYIEKLSDREHYWIKTLYGPGMLNVYLNGNDNAVGPANPNAKYSEDTLTKLFLDIVNLPAISLEDISKKYGVPVNTIKAITSGKSHLWLKDKFPSEYKTMKNNVNLRKSLNASNSKSGMVLKSPTGELVTVTDSLSSFARKHSLQVSNLSNVVNGKAITHKGWTLFKGG